MSVAGKTAPARLPDIVGSEHFSSDPAELSPYAVDGRVPAAVVRPGSKEELVEIVKYAASEKLAIIASGARTKLRIGLQPNRYDLALDMTRFNRVIAYDPGDLTLSVEAGVPLRNITATLGERRQFLPLAVPYSRNATIGGTIASGVDSPLRQFYGTARDYVLGMEFVTGEGAYTKSGGRVVKNVTGYDLHKLMIGALGSLGVITRVNFKTFPFPAGSHGFVATFDSLESAIGMRHRIAHSPLTPLTLETLSPRVAELFLLSATTRTDEPSVPAGILSPRHWTLTTAYIGNQEVLARYEFDLRRIAAESGAASVSVLDDNTRPSVWGRLRESLPILLDSTSGATIVKIGVLPARLQDALTVAANAADANQVPWAAIARGLGVIYFALLPNELTDATRRQVGAATNQIFASCTALSANLTIPWCPQDWKGTLKIWGPERGDSSEMRKVKKIFDPLGIFSPGRFVGGL
jgi:glycolate oxidase FAD binding subunit